MIDLRDKLRLAVVESESYVTTVLLHRRRECPELADQVCAVELFKSLGWHTVRSQVEAQGEDDWIRAYCPICPIPPRGSYSLNWRHANRARLHMVDAHGWRFRVA